MNELLSYIDSRKKELIDFTRKLIETRTVNPPGNDYEKMVDLLEDRCNKIGLKTKRIFTPKKYLEKKGIMEGSKRINLIADWNTGAKKTFHIAGHYDVVPATGNWRTDPFKAIVKDDFIYGRGSEDMKGTIAAMLLAVEAVKKGWIAPNVNIQMAFTPDEEIGGETGFGWLVKNGFIKADFAISEGHSDDYVSYGNKGILWIEIEVLGRSCHASRPSKGINAFEKMIELVKELEILKEDVEKRKTKYCSRDEQARCASLVMGGLLSGQSKINVVPDKVIFSIDRRILPEEGVKQVKDEILSLIRKVRRRDKDFRAKVRIRSEHPPVIVKDGGEIDRAIGHAIKTVTGRHARHALLAGGTDMRYLITRGIPAVGYSAQGGGMWHSDNEYVSIKSMLDTSKVYALTIINL